MSGRTQTTTGPLVSVKELLGSNYRSSMSPVQALAKILKEYRSGEPAQFALSALFHSASSVCRSERLLNNLQRRQQQLRHFGDHVDLRVHHFGDLVNDSRSQYRRHLGGIKPVHLLQPQR